MRTVVVVGAGGMGREAAAWASDIGLEIAGFIDDGVATGTTVAGLTVLGGRAHLATLDAAVGVVLAVGDGPTRGRIADALPDGCTPTTLVHPTAHVGPNVVVGGGSIVAPNVTVTRDGALGSCVIVNFGAQVGHDCRIGDHSFVGPGAVLAGNVTVGSRVQVGAGAVVLQGRTVGDGAVVGAGAVVTRDVPAAVTVVGVPARAVEGRGSDT